MTLKDCYIAINGDYEGVVSRLQGERLVRKFVVKFLADTSYDTLCLSLKTGDYQEAFRAAHTIKGICQNLGFTALLHSSSALSDALRSNQLQDIPALAGRLEEDYKRTVSAIRMLQEEDVC